MESLILSIGVAIVVVFLKVKVFRQEKRIDRLEAAVRELNPGLGWDWTR